MAAQPWTILQLGGQKRKVVLKGWSAPRGRPRQSAFVSDGVQMREQSTRYPDTDMSVPPTRHLFGGDYDDWMLEGRIRGREEGDAAGVEALVRTLRAMVLEGQAVQITRGSHLAIQGLLKSFIPGRESESEVTYQLKVLVDIDFLDQTFSGARESTIPAAPAASAQTVLALCGPALQATSVPEAQGLRIGVLDFIDDAIGVLNGAIGQLVNAANAIDSLESALSSDVKRLQAGVHQTKTALLTFMSAVDAIDRDTGGNVDVFARSSSTDRAAWCAYKADMTASAYKALALLADEDRRTEIALTGNQGTTTTATGGETWEAISTRVYGGPSGADALRKANGAKYGALPQAGQTIHVPRAA